MSVSTSIGNYTKLRIINSNEDFLAILNASEFMKNPKDMFVMYFSYGDVCNRLKYQKELYS